MEKQLNELVYRLTQKQPVECSRPGKNANSLKRCLDNDFIHVMFLNTHTELGVRLDRKSSSFENADFEKSEGKVVVKGRLTLNYNKVRCVAEIDLATCEGTGYLEPVTDAEYEAMKSN